MHAADFDFHFFHHFDGWKYTDFQQIIQLYHVISSKVLYVFELTKNIQKAYINYFIMILQNLNIFIYKGFGE